MVPAARSVSATGEVLGLRVPAELAGSSPPAAPAAQAASVMAPDTSGKARERAVELDRVVPPSGNVWLAGQQIWLGSAMTGRVIRLWAGLDRVHVLLDGYRIKTLPTRLDHWDLARLAAAGPGLPGGRRCPRPPVPSSKSTGPSAPPGTSASATR